MSFLHALRTQMWKLGLDISRYNPLYNPLARKGSLMRFCGIDTVLDVGAGCGQFAQFLRSQGYKKKMISFEPLSSEFKRLEKNSKRDKNWQVFHCALGASSGRGEINIALNRRSSSLLEMLPSHVLATPDSKYVGKDTIEVKTLDSIFPNLCSKSERVFLKIDTQGYEKYILEGAKNSLPSIDLIQLEMSFVPLYKGEVLFCDLYDFLSNLGYRLISLEEVLADRKSYQLLQVDGLFHRILR